MDNSLESAEQPRPFGLPQSGEEIPDARKRLNEILRAVAQEDQRAFAALYRATSSHIFAVILRMVRTRAEAEEILQEVYVSVWRQASTFAPERGSAMTWLLALARNRAIDRMREHRESTLDEAELLSIASEDPTPANLAESGEQRRLLEQCMQQLAPEQRHAIREAFFSGLTYSELATRLEVPLGTLKSWIRRSLLQLRSCLER